MTRVEQNKDKYKVKNKKKLNKNVKEFFKSIIAFVVGFVYLIYVIVESINKFVCKMFMKMPKIARILIIYTLIGLAIYGQVYQKVIIKEVVVEEELKITVEDKREDNNVEASKPTSNEQNTKLNGIALKIYEKALEQGLNSNQAYILVAISRHETGNWTSNAFKTKNNFGGIMCNTGLRAYNTQEDGLNAFVKLLKDYYFGLGLNTIEQIGAKYCPVGATNDPLGVNVYWVPNVTKYYNEYVSK